MRSSWNEGYRYRERLGPGARGWPVIEYLADRYPHSSAGQWLQRIETGRVLVDDRPALPRQRLLSGQVLTWNRPPWREPPAPTSFAVLYDDPHFLAVAKPSGLPAMPGGGFLNGTLLALVRKHYPEGTPLHRLGRGTSGITLFGRSLAARRRLTTSWQGAVLRVYRTLVAGDLEPERLSIDTPIGRVPHPILGTVHAASPGGKPSLSHVCVLERRGENTLVAVEIVTGRPHQIRIHLAAAGHPLVGDPLYAAGGVPDTQCHALPGDPGYLLHAASVRFPHPETEEPVFIDCLPPPALRVREGDVR